MDVFQLEILYVKEKNFWKNKAFFYKGAPKVYQVNCYLWLKPIFEYNNMIRV